MTTSGMLPQVVAESSPGTRWFSANGCVRGNNDRYEVFVGGSLIGVFASGERTERNLLLLGLASDPQTHLHRLAEAFGISFKTLRQIRVRYDQGGAEALRPKRGGRKSMRTQTLRRRLYKLFDAGSTVTGAYEATGKRVSRTLVGRMRKEWSAERDSKIASTPSRSEQHADATLREQLASACAVAYLTGRGAMCRTWHQPDWPASGSRESCPRGAGPPVGGSTCTRSTCSA
jgi:hypothetical protein